MSDTASPAARCPGIDPALRDAPGARRRHRPGLRRPAAGGRPGQGRLARHRHRPGRRQGGRRSAAARATSRTCRRRTSRRWSRPGRLTATTDFRRAGCGGRGQHLRAHPAAQDRRPRPVLHPLGHRRRCAPYVHPGMVVVLESTTYPGTTREMLLPELEAGGLKVGRGFLPGLLARARRPRPQGLDDQEHPQGDRRHHRRPARRWRRRCTRRR